MPDAVEAVVGEGPGDEGLGGQLEDGGPLGEAGGQHGALEVQAGVGRDQVEGAEGVEAAAHEPARNAVQDRAVPRDLRAVDTQVRGDGAREALFVEDGVRGVFVRDGRGRCPSGRRVSEGEAGSKGGAAGAYLR